MTKPSQLNAEIAVAVAQPRERDTGKYAHRSFDTPCRCGHSLGEHTADRSGGTQPCMVATGCDCEVFRKAPIAKTKKAPAPRVVTTTLSGLLKALGMSIEDLRRDRRYTKARGDEPIVLETIGGNQLHIMEAPPWLVAQDFGPIGVSWAKRAGWY